MPASLRHSSLGVAKTEDLPEYAEVQKELASFVAAKSVVTDNTQPTTDNVQSVAPIANEGEPLSL